MTYGFYRGETPTYIAKPKNFTVSEIQSAKLVIKNGNILTVKDLSDLVADTDANQLRYDFSQEETLAFKPNSYVTFELTILTFDKRFEVSEQSWKVGDTYYNEVMTHD